MEKFVLIMAGGSGTRMGGDIPKQFLEINGKPLILHTISRFLEFDPDINLVVVLPPGQFSRWHECCKTHAFCRSHLLIPGGSERFFSVKNGLEPISRDGIVFIHDAVRPLVSRDTLERCDRGAAEKGNAIPVWPVNESLRKTESGRNFAVDRASYFLVQTPQTFQAALIKNAYNQAYQTGFTDDASVLEATGEPVNLVAGNRENIKVTFPSDLTTAGALLT